jgi:hypothetical protein
MHDNLHSRLDNMNVSPILHPGFSMRKQSSRSFYLFLLGGVLLVQFALVSYTFPLGELTSDKPIFYYDTTFHWYEIWFAQALADVGRWTGYDPYFSAGLANGATLNMSARAPALLAVLAGSDMSAAAAYKWFGFVSAMIAPACVVVACYSLGIPRFVAFVAALFSIITWWTTDFRAFYSIGMVAFATASFLALPYATLSLRYLTSNGSSLLALIGLGAAAGAGIFYHPLFPIPVATAVILLALAFWRNLNRSHVLLYCLIIPIASVLINSFWILDVRSYSVQMSEGLVSGLERVGTDLLWRPILGLSTAWPHGSKWYALLIFCAGWGCAAPPGQHRRIARSLSAAGGLLILFSAFGSILPVLADLQPNRFLASGYLMLVLPASMGFATLAEKLRNQAGGRMAAHYTAIASFTAVLLVTAYYMNEVRRELSPEPIGHYGATPPEVRGIGQETRVIRAWLEQNTDVSARVLFETTSGNRLDKSQIVGYLAAVTGREFIGGPYPRFTFSDFADARAFGRPIDEIPCSTFHDYLELYNIGWIAVFQPQSRKFLSNCPGLVALDEVGPLLFYRVERQSSYFVQGSGRVAGRGPNYLLLEDLAGSEVILKYHFFEELTTSPPTQIDSIQMMNDPVPFIRLKSPPSSLRIYIN